jgi:D-alanyl-D-alanine carboxypeptidase
VDLEKQQAIFAYNVALLISYIFHRQYSCTLGEAYRTKEQAEIYAQKGIGIEDSLHCQRLAIDLNIFSPRGELLTKTEDYKVFGDYWKKLDGQNNWGGNFKRGDGNHFEMSLPKN